MKEEMRETCWRCHGKCLEFGRKTSTSKPTWHPCFACSGKGWLPLGAPKDTLQAAMWQKAVEMFESMGARFVDVTDQIVREKTKPEEDRDK
jgi:hypothetical protein